MYDMKKIQRALHVKGFYKGAIDGINGPKTKKAITAFKKSVGLRARPLVGPVTYAKLVGDSRELQAKVRMSTPYPWYNKLLEFRGLHEQRDNQALKDWLKSDGATVGDPAEIPWCGDAMETCMRLTLPNEPIPENPYLAANWTNFGVPVAPQLGSVLIFWRGKPSSWKGHIGLYAGESKDNYYVLGGNQSNRISIAPLSKKRLRKGGSRWPLNGPRPLGTRISMLGGKLSVNEA